MITQVGVIQLSPQYFAVCCEEAPQCGEDGEFHIVSKKIIPDFNKAKSHAQRFFSHHCSSTPGAVFHQQLVFLNKPLIVVIKDITSERFSRHRYHLAVLFSEKSPELLDFQGSERAAEKEGHHRAETLGYSFLPHHVFSTILPEEN